MAQLPALQDCTAAFHLTCSKRFCNGTFVYKIFIYISNYLLERTTRTEISKSKSMNFLKINLFPEYHTYPLYEI